MRLGIFFAGKAQGKFSTHVNSWPRSRPTRRRSRCRCSRPGSVVSATARAGGSCSWSASSACSPPRPPASTPRLPGLPMVVRRCNILGLHAVPEGELLRLLRVLGVVHARGAWRCTSPSSPPGWGRPRGSSTRRSTRGGHGQLGLQPRRRAVLPLAHPGHHRARLDLPHLGGAVRRRGRTPACRRPRGAAHRGGGEDARRAPPTTTERD
jgi:hypothetical protein